MNSVWRNGAHAALLFFSIPALLNAAIPRPKSPLGYDMYYARQDLRDSLYKMKDFPAIQAWSDRQTLAHKNTLENVGPVYFALTEIAPDLSPESMGDILDEAVRLNPKSQIFRTLRGRFLIKYGWYARGGGWGKDVKREDFRMFRLREKAAQGDLLAAAAMDPANPAPYTFLVIASVALSEPRAVMEGYFLNAVKNDPGNVTAYSWKLEYLKPKWMGSEPDMWGWAGHARRLSAQYPALYDVWMNALLENYLFIKRAQEPRRDIQDPETWRAIVDWYRVKFSSSSDPIAEWGGYAWFSYLSGHYDVAMDAMAHLGSAWVIGTWPTDEGYQKARGFLFRLKANELAKNGQLVNAVPFYEKAIAENDDYSMTYLGWLYFEGQELPANTDVAIRLFTRAAAMNNLQALNNLGHAYQIGRGVPQNLERAMALFQQAAGQGHAQALANVGWLYYEGLGVPKDLAVAYGWFEKSAAKQDAWAMNQIGWMWQNGEGRPVDLKKAAEWYQKAADAGFADAKVNLAALSVNR